MRSRKILALSLALVGLSVVTALAMVFILKSPSRRNSISPQSRRDALISGQADRRILFAQKTIERAPNRPEGYNQLASAYLQKARESSDFSFYAKAESALTRSFEVEPDNYDAVKLKAKIELSQHRFKDALKTARRAQLRRLDDHEVWGEITDALVELGDYSGAVRAAQKMVDLRPDSSAYARISYLRSLHGDTEGAIQTMKMAVRATDPRDPEGVAWCRVQLGNEFLNAGNPVEAEREFEGALLTFSGYRPALEAKAKAKLAAGDFSGALSIYERQQAEAPTADGALAIADLQTYLGRPIEARKNYEAFESLERENAATENSWRHMVNYWLDQDRNLSQALEFAAREYEVRKDVFTCDSFAWALFKNGRFAEANKLIKEALRLGTRDTRINYHAGVIYKALNMHSKAARHLELALSMSSSPNLHQTESAKQLLDELN
jgi:tetratricopeptide (TPR) repeat protein